MPRAARRRSASGIYHITLRGINKQDIFHDMQDHVKFLQTLKKAGLGSAYQLLAFCLMSNHVHLLVCEAEESVSQVMKRIGVRYATYYNYKYERKGHLFQDRFRSEKVENDEYLLTVVGYIHRNPVKAGIVNTAEDYLWSSARVYSYSHTIVGLQVETGLVFSLFAESQQEAVVRYRRFMETPIEAQCLEYEDERKLSDEELERRIQQLLDGLPVSALHGLSKRQRNEILKQIKKLKGSTVRQISQVTGISKSVVQRV